MLTCLLFALVVGVPQPAPGVHHLTFIATAGVASGDISVEVGGMPATVLRVQRVVHPSDGATDRLIVLLVDEMHIPSATLPAVNEVIASITKDVAPGAAFAIATTSGRFKLNETTDRASVIDALSRLDASYSRWRRAPVKTTDGNGDPNSTATLLQSYSEESALDALARTASVFANDGRRHVLVWLTSESVQARWSSRGERAAAALLDHSVWAYGIDTTVAPRLVKEGHAPIPSIDDEVIPLVQEKRPFHALKTVAARCGGFALVGGSDLRGGLTRLGGAIDNYYDVTFAVEGAVPPGAFVTVSTKQPDVTLQTRERFGTGS